MAYLTLIQALCASDVATVTVEEFEENLYGLQLCFFEVLWSVERQLTHIFGRAKDGRIELHFSPSLPPDRAALCLRLANEVIGVAFEGQTVTASFGHTPKDAGWHRLMSQEIFKSIALEHAPWRLEEGR